MVFGLYKWSLIERQETGRLDQDVYDGRGGVWPSVMVQKNDANKVQQNKTFQFRHYVMNLYWEDKKYSLRNSCGRKDEGHLNYQRACAHAETKHAGWENQSLKPSKALFSFERYRDKENTCLLSKIFQCLPFRCFIQDMYKCWTNLKHL